MPVYLDYNATTPLAPEVQEEIYLSLKNSWGNPSSSYALGEKAKDAIEKARHQVADMIKATPEEIIFTSGGTESNHMVIHSIIQHFHEECAKSGTNEIPHIITSNIEHDSVRLPLEALAKEGKVSVTFVPASKVIGGVVDEADICNAIRPNTRLISLMLANNETGLIQPVAFLEDFLKYYKRQPPIYVHTDAAQAIGKDKVYVQELGVHYLTIVGHKFYGQRIGALYVKKSCPLYPVFYGGGQERGYRSGTENTCMIAGLGKAAELVTHNLEKYIWHLSKTRDYLEESLKNAFSDSVVFNCQSKNPLAYSKLPNTVSVAFEHKNISGKVLLETSGIYASTGAACHTAGKPSAILMASGVSESLAERTLRLSIGRETTEEDIDKAVNCLKKAISQLLNKQQ